MFSVEGALASEMPAVASEIVSSSFSTASCPSSTWTEGTASSPEVPSKLICSYPSSKSTCSCSDRDFAHNALLGNLTKHLHGVKPGLDALEADFVIDFRYCDTLDVYLAAVGFGRDFFSFTVIILGSVSERGGGVLLTR
jgi:hypothetical protein